MCLSSVVMLASLLLLRLAQVLICCHLALVGIGDHRLAVASASAVCWLKAAAAEASWEL
jgi:hypothetical protein